MTKPEEVAMDARGRVVIPREERRRLGVEGGAVFALVGTPEGVLLERRRTATVETAADGLPVVRLEDGARINNGDAVIRLHAVRDSSSSHPSA